MVQTIIYAICIVVFLIDCINTVQQNKLLKKQNEYLVKYLGIKCEESEETREKEHE